jgi:hypothetical protein
VSQPIYAWQEPYMAAVRETDDANMPGRILEATSAIEQRLLSPVEPGSEEDRAIQKAQRGLAALRAERCRPEVSGDSSGFFSTEA